MKFKINCEESQAVTIALRKKGIIAYSCDILPCSGGHPEWHLQEDALKRNKGYKVISFPPCTDLSLSGAAWFKNKRLSGSQEQSINFFLDIWEVSHCVENPMNIMTGWKYLRKWFPGIVERMQDINFPIKETQRIHPWQFGHKEQKTTLLWLRGLPELKPTRNVYKEMMKLPVSVRERLHHLPKTKYRSMIRSKTYQGIANAMAEQWSII